MKRKKPRISPEVRYNAVMELIRNQDTFKNVARRNNISISSLWNYCADVDAAIKKVVGLDENYRLEQEKMPFRNAGSGRNKHNAHSDQCEQIKTASDSNKDNEIVIRLKVSTH